jgi:post-segregation antitoxin (ccd killing protein)
MAQISLYVPDDLMARLRARAKEEQLPLSRLAGRAIRALLEPGDEQAELDRISRDIRKILREHGLL